MSLPGFANSPLPISDLTILTNYLEQNDINNYTLIQDKNNEHVAIPSMPSSCNNLKVIIYQVQDGHVYKKVEQLKDVQADACPSGATCSSWCSGGQGKCKMGYDTPGTATGMCCGGAPGPPSPGPPPPPSPAPISLYTGAPYTFPTKRTPYQKVRWLYTCAKGQGTACVIPGSSVTPTADDLIKNGINYISLITGMSLPNAGNFNACSYVSGSPPPHSLFYLPAVTLPNNCGSDCANAEAGQETRATCLLVGQGTVSLPYKISEIIKAHNNGVSISIVLGSWGMVFPNQYTIALLDTEKITQVFANTLYCRFMELRFLLNNCIDGIDFDWEGFATSTCSWSAGCDKNGWDTKCSGDGWDESTKAPQKTALGAACYQLANNKITIEYINKIAEIFKANPLAKNSKQKTYNGQPLVILTADRDYGATGPLSVTVVPMSSQMFSSLTYSTKFNGQNQYVGLDPTKIDALLLQWYSGFDGGATGKPNPKWNPPWLKLLKDSARIEAARGCATNASSVTTSNIPSWLPSKINTSIVEGDMNKNTVVPPTTDPVNYLQWMNSEYGNDDINARCKAVTVFGDKDDEYSARCPRRMDCADWFYTDDKFIHQSQLYLVNQFKELKWDIGTQIIIGLEFFDTRNKKSSAPSVTAPKYASQWGPVPDAYWVGGLDAAIKGVDAYNTYYDGTLTPATYKATFEGESSNILDSKGLAGIGGWTLAGADNTSPYPWKNFLDYLCGDKFTKSTMYPQCGGKIPNPTGVTGSGDTYYTIPNA